MAGQEQQQQEEIVPTQPQAAEPPVPEGVDPEFLAALPEEMRQEVKLIFHFLNNNSNV